MEQINIDIIYNELLKQNIKCEKCLSIKLERSSGGFIGCNCTTSNFLMESSGFFIYKMFSKIFISTYSFNVLNGMPKDCENFNYTEICLYYSNNAYLINLDSSNKNIRDFFLDFKSNDIIKSIIFVKNTCEKILNNSIFI